VKNKKGYTGVQKERGVVVTGQALKSRKGKKYYKIYRGGGSNLKMSTGCAAHCVVLPESHLGKKGCGGSE